jgi:hypothetical protein
MMEDPIFAVIDIETAKHEHAEERAALWHFSADKRCTKPESIAESLEKQRTKFVDKAALNPATAAVKMINFSMPDGSFQMCAGDYEQSNLIEGWGVIQSLIEDGVPIVGFNLDWDMSVLIHRSWDLEIPIPAGVTKEYHGGLYLSRYFIDLLKVSQLGFSHDYISLHNLCVTLGIEGKNGDGADFGAMWDGPENRPKVYEYAENDLVITRRAALKMLQGVLL